MAIEFGFYRGLSSMKTPLLVWPCAATFLFLTSVLGTSLANDQCLGTAYQPHSLAHYNFETNSRLDTTNQVPRLFDCIHNADLNKDGWLRIEWYVTAFRDTWIPPNTSVEMARSFVHDIDPSKVRPYGSCLEYGGTGQVVIANFMNDEPETAEARAMNPHCEPQHADADGSPSHKHPLLYVSLPINVFVPSDTKNPTDTMLQITGAIQYKPNSDNSFSSNFNYSVERYRDSKGDISAVRLQPVFDTVTQSLSSYFLLSYPEGTAPLVPNANSDTSNGKADVSFSVTGSHDWLVAPMLIKFIDKSGGELSAMQIPIYVVDP